VAGTLDVLNPGVLDRAPAQADLSANEHGTGRDLFGAFRRSVGPAELGASSLFTEISA
jgi:phosphogluconate dehydratase